MALITDFVFFTQILLFFGIFLLKTYNLMHKSLFMTIQQYWITNISLLIVWGIGLLITLANYTELTISIIFSFESFFLAFAFLVGFAEFLFYLGNLGVRTVERNNRPTRRR